MFELMLSEYPEVDPRSYKNFRVRCYELNAFTEIMDYCINHPQKDISDILWEYKLLFEYENLLCPNDIMGFRLGVVKRMEEYIERKEYL